MEKITISTGHPDAGRVYAEAYDAALEREAALQTSLDAVAFNLDKTDKLALALREELTTAKRAVPHTAGGGISQRDFDYDRGFSAGSAEVETFRLERDALQQRLTVAEQRLSQVDGACDLAMSAIDDDERGANFFKIIQAIKDKAALKPAAEGEGS